MKLQLPSIFSALTKPDPIRSPRRIFYGAASKGTSVGEDSCMESSAFYRGVNYLSGQLAKLPWEVKERDNTVVENDLSYLLNVSPNGETTAFKFKLFLIQCALITGNGYAEIERDITGRVLRLWPLNPRKVSTLRNLAGELFYEVAGGGLDGTSVYFRPKDILHVANIHTVDGITGQSIVAYAQTTLGVSVGADRFANSLFANGGMPSGVLKVQGTLNDEAYERLKTSWKEQQAGRATGSTAILEAGTDYSPISHSPDVLQFLESRKFSVTEIARFLGVPPQKLFDTDSAKYSNMEQAQLEVGTDTLDTWCRNLESEADLKLLGGRKGGRRTELDLASLARGDSAARATYFKSMQASGALTPNEIRKKEGLPPSLDPAANKLYLPTNNLTPMDRIDEVIDAQITSKTKTATGDPDPEKEETQKALANATIEYLKS